MKVNRNLLASMQHDPGIYHEVQVKEVLYHGTSDFQTIMICDTGRLGRCLFLDGVIQSSDADHSIYDQALLANLPQGEGSVLILGGGDGFVAGTALKKNPKLEITVVDVDHTLVTACRQYFANDAFESPRVTFVYDEALNFLRRSTASYGLIISDLTDVPIMTAQDHGIIDDYYLELLRLVTNRIFDRQAITLYAGCDRSLGEHISQFPFFENCKIEAVYVPSFGEYCYVLHGQIVH